MGFTGDVLKGDQLRGILQGLQRNDLLQDIGHVLTGYVGSESFLSAVLDVIQALRAVNDKVRYVCDPVLGDAGRFYVPKELVGLYRERVIPLADVLTPNQFEVEQLTGRPISSMEDAKVACRQLHDMGPALIFITSLVLGDHPSHMSIVTSRKTDSEQTMWTIECPILPGHFTGTGDLCAALLLAHSSECTDDVAMERVINTMYAILERTHLSVGPSVKSRELKLIQSKDVIEDPPLRFRAHRLE